MPPHLPAPLSRPGAPSSRGAGRRPDDGGSRRVDRLLAVLAEGADEQARLGALEALEREGDERVAGAIEAAAAGRHGRLRLASVAWLTRRPDPLPLLADRLRLDAAPEVRRALVRALAAMGAGAAPSLLVALTDPVWRVRRDAVRALGAMGEGDRGLQEQIASATLAARPLAWAALGALHALEDRWGRRRSVAPAGAVLPAPGALCALPFWDNDPPVLARRLELARAEELWEHREQLPRLLTLQGGRPENDFLEAIRCRVAEVLLALGETADDARVAGLCAEPRLPFVLSAVERYLSALPPARVAALARLPGPALPPPARAFLAAPPAPGIDPSCLAPRRPAPTPRGQPGHEARFEVTEAPRRRLGARGPWVSPLGVSGRYGLAPRGYREALDRGVNLFFWEPDYSVLTSFVAGLGPGARAELVVAAGSFEASARGIRRDVERALRALRLERLPVFFLFWVRSAGRLLDEAAGTLAALAEEGKIGLPGLSTHDRGLALLGLSLGLPVVMARHSAAHPGAELALLPEAARRGAGVITFSALCYGRLLASPGREGASAPDCYRYSLAQPGVSACISAPRSVAELRENLSALAAPPLTEAEGARLRRVGARVHEENVAFADLLRSR